MITSSSNGKVKQLIKWQTKRKARDLDKIFIIEGTRIFSEIPRDHVGEIYVSETYYKKHSEELSANGWMPYTEVLSDSVFEHVSDTKTPQGVLAVVEQAAYDLEEILGSKEAPLLIVLDNLQDPGNLGTILRAGEAAGATGVIMSKGCVDIYNPKVIRSTMGAIFRVPFVYVEDLVEVIEDLSKRGIISYAAHLKGKNDYDEEGYKVPTAFLIGNEGNGLSDEVADAAAKYIKIPMCGEVESLNAAMAATVLLFEAARQRRH